MQESSTIHYQITGRGKPILLIHGWTMHSGVWGDFVQEFAATYKIITVDLRGHGKSVSVGGPYNFPTFAEDVVNLMQTLDLKEVTCIGWSMGVSIILQLYEGAKGLMDSLVFISGNPSLVARKDYQLGTPEDTVARLFNQMERDYPQGLRGFHDLLFTPEELSALKNSSGHTTVTDINAGASKQAALEALKWSLHGDLRPILQTIDVPTLIIHGNRDQVCMPEAARYMYARISGSQLLMLGGAGHVPFITRQSEVHRAIKDFIANL